MTRLIDEMVQTGPAGSGCLRGKRKRKRKDLQEDDSDSRAPSSEDSLDKVHDQKKRRQLKMA